MVFTTQAVFKAQIISGLALNKLWIAHIGKVTWTTECSCVCFAALVGLAPWHSGLGMDEANIHMETEHSSRETRLWLKSPLNWRATPWGFIYLNFHFRTMRCPQKWIHERLLYHRGSYTATLFSSLPTPPLTSGYLKGINTCCALLFNYTLTTENINT